MTVAKAMALLSMFATGAAAVDGVVDPRTEAQFGPGSSTVDRWLQERPTEHNVDGLSEAGLISTLSSYGWEERGLRKSPSPLAFSRGARLTPRQIDRATRHLENGQLELAWRVLRRATKWLHLGNEREARRVHRLMAELASVYVDLDDFDRAVRIYEEMLLLSRFLHPRHTRFALNRLIATHFERQEYEAALMYVRVGIAVLDGIGLRPYLTMNRIIHEMSSLDGAIEDFERDFDAAVRRLEEAAAEAEAQGLDIEAQWWAPVYFARHDREEAMRLFKVLLRPLPAGDANAALREAVLEEERGLVQ